MLPVIIYILSLISFAKTFHINDFFSKDICTLLLEKNVKTNQKIKKRYYKKNHFKKKYKKKKIKKKYKKKLNIKSDTKNYYLIDKRFKKKYKVVVVKYKGKYYIMINDGFYKEKDYIEDYLIHEIHLDKIILKKKDKYYIWML